jgi:hypothetical protein
MKFYSAIYTLESEEFSSYIYAQDRDSAAQMVQKRNIGERIIGVHVNKKGFDPHPLPSVMYQARKLIECAHTLTFYSWLASRSGVMNLESEMMSDHGILHELFHEMHHPDVYGFREKVLKRMTYMEARIPGLISYIPPSEPDPQQPIVFK